MSNDLLKDLTIKLSYLIYCEYLIKLFLNFIILLKKFDFYSMVK